MTSTEVHRATPLLGHNRLASPTRPSERDPRGIRYSRRKSSSSTASNLAGGHWLPCGSAVFPLVVGEFLHLGAVILHDGRSRRKRCAAPVQRTSSF